MNQGGNCCLRGFLAFSAFLMLTPACAFSQAVMGADGSGPAEAATADDLGALERAAQYLSRGLSRATLGMREEALVDLTLAINQHALSPTDQAQALYNRGLLLEEIGDKKNAAADYAGALSLDPHLELASVRLNALNQLLSPVVPLKARSSADKPALVISTSVMPDLKPAIAERSERTQLQIQLGAWRTEGEANEMWKEISARAGEVLQEFTPNIFEAEVPGKGRYFRLRLGPMNKKTAEHLCGELKSRGMACIPVISS